MTVDVGPPVQTGPTVRRWVSANLFGSPVNVAMTIVFGAGLVFVVWRLLRFVFVTGRWDVVRDNLTTFMVGTLPRDDVWRVWVAIFIIATLIGFRWGIGRTVRSLDPRAPEARPFHDVAVRVWPLVLLAVVFLALSPSLRTVGLLGALALAVAGARALGRRLPLRAHRFSPFILAGGVVLSFSVISLGGGQGYARWQGLLLTVFAAVAGIVLSFPFGVLLALGRRSKLPAIRGLSVAYIELIRGVPLITLLFMAVFVIGLFLPPGTPVPSTTTRGLIALIAFTAAYIAEIVRGGLQSIPRGQIEAAAAVGLSPIATTRLIVLPQALRAVIPAIVGQFISLFKDTSLLGFIGLIELLGVAQQVTAQPEFLGQGLQAETLLFASTIYWTGAYWMSRASQRLERRLGVGER